MDALFNMEKSSTAEVIPCGPECLKLEHSACKNGKCTYTRDYLEGSSLSGEFFKDEVRLGRLAQDNPAVKMVLGCHNKETNLFSSQLANGIMGIAPHRNLENSALPMIFNSTSLNARIFSICLSARGGR